MEMVYGLNHKQQVLFKQMWKWEEGFFYTVSFFFNLYLFTYLWASYTNLIKHY